MIFTAADAALLEVGDESDGDDEPSRVLLVPILLFGEYTLGKKRRNNSYPPINATNSMAFRHKAVMKADVFTSFVFADVKGS